MNRAYIYAIISLSSELAALITLEPTSDLFSYITIATSNPRYTSTAFIRIIIDIGALRRLTVGYGQF
jgi:hypothetical protein